jgi:hypothetical protein
MVSKSGQLSSAQFSSTISKMMSTLCEDDKGTFLPKTIFNITEKKQKPTEHGKWNTAINDQG